MSPERKSKYGVWAFLSFVGLGLALFGFILWSVSLPTPRDTKLDQKLSYQFGYSQTGPFAAWWGGAPIDGCQQSIFVHKPDARPAWWTEDSVYQGCLDYVNHH